MGQRSSRMIRKFLTSSCHPEVLCSFRLCCGYSLGLLVTFCPGFAPPSLAYTSHTRARVIEIWPKYQVLSPKSKFQTPPPPLPHTHPCRILELRILRKMWILPLSASGSFFTLSRIYTLSFLTRALAISLSH